MHHYQEIENLKSHFKAHTIQITKTPKLIRDDFFYVDLIIDNHKWTILIDDEYNDFSQDNPTLNLFLVFNAIEDYIDSDDFLVWCKENFLSASNEELLYYYKSLANIYREIETIIGKIDSEISGFDYSLNTGVMKSLRELG